MGVTSLLVQFSEYEGFLWGILLLIREGNREAQSSSSCSRATITLSQQLLLGWAEDGAVTFCRLSWGKPWGSARCHMACLWSCLSGSNTPLVAIAPSPKLVRNDHDIHYSRVH